MAYKVGIVGMGSIGCTHACACQQVEQAELVAICDISPEALARHGDEFSVSQRYVKLEDMLAQEALDILIIGTWGISHALMSNAAARSRRVRAILVEKPISMNAAECEEMIAVARDNNVWIAEGLKVLHHPQYARVGEIIDSGRIGNLRMIRSTISSAIVDWAPPDNWRFDARLGGGSVYDLACYPIAYARGIVGAEPERVYAVGAFGEGSDVDLSATIVLEFPDDVTAQLFSSYDGGTCQSTEILGSRGWIHMDLHYDERSGRGIEVFCDDHDAEVHRLGPADQFVLQLEHLCECLDTGRPYRVSPEFSLGNMRTIDAVNESMRSGEPVDLRPAEKGRRSQGGGI
jgi:predicted dehydrogenase